MLAPGTRPLLPMPMVNIISGGAHAGRALDVQDIRRAAIEPGTDIGIAIDMAATQFYDTDTRTYRLAVDQREYTATELVDELAHWCAGYPIASIEDALADQDWEGWHPPPTICWYQDRRPDGRPG